MEVWKSLKGYEGIYEVSSKGRVKSLRRYSNEKQKRLLKEKILKPTDRGGYDRYTLRVNGKRNHICSHQLVAICFLNHNTNNNRLVVDHIDNDPKNNCVENLQLISSRENSIKDKYNKPNKSSIYPGVCFVKNRGKYVSYIRIGKHRKNLGCFKCETSAYLRYIEELKKII